MVGKRKKRNEEIERREETNRQGRGNLNLKAESRIAERGFVQPYL